MFVFFFYICFAVMSSLHSIPEEMEIASDSESIEIIDDPELEALLLADDVESFVMVENPVSPQSVSEPDSVVLHPVSEEPVVAEEPIIPEEPVIAVDPTNPVEPEAEDLLHYVSPLLRDRARVRRRRSPVVRIPRERQRRDPIPRVRREGRVMRLTDIFRQRDRNGRSVPVCYSCNRPRHVARYCNEVYDRTRRTRPCTRCGHHRSDREGLCCRCRREENRRRSLR